jgi:hypothetical protein
MIVNLDGNWQGSDPERTSEIKRWVTEVLRLDHDTSVMVTELRCTEPGCPPFETVVALLYPDQSPWQFKLHKPVDEIDYKDIQAIAEASNVDKSPEKSN